jgi:pyridoxamine 5'-phosphate oxidase-like protein
VAKQRVETKNLDIYGDKMLPWSRARRQLVAVTKGTPRSNRGSPWLATTGPGGRTHLTGVGALWVDDRFYFVSGPGTRKSRNVARNPRCAISMSLRDIDIVMEGTARRVTDEKTLRRLARLYVAQGWPVRAEKKAFMAPYNAPSAGRPPWYLYDLRPEMAFGVATKKPFGATRWTFKGTAKRG